MSEKPTYEELEQRVRELVKSESEHQQTEEALRASEERFRNLIEGSMQGILIHKDFKPLFLNKAYADIHGYTVDEILGMEIFPTLFAPNERTRIAEYNQARMQNKETPVKYEFQGQQKDGSSIWLNNVVRVIEWEGQPAIQSTIIDISARKLAEEKLRESEEYYRILLDAADHAGIGFILDQDIEGKEAICVFANETASNITGYSIEELSKLSWKELHHPKYQDMAVQRHRRRMTGEVMQGIFEISIITKDGREVPVEISSTQTEYQGDIALISFFKEITERKQAEEALRESEESLRTTINSIGDAVLATDTYGNIVRMNPVAEKLTGWGADDAKDKPVTEVFNIINAKTGEKVEHPVKRVLEEGEIIGLANHTMLIARDSTEYQIADSAAPIRDGEGNLTGVVLVFRDVTQE
ncbi:MAG: PAS domain S-box protein, partial [Candidatus Brocadiales bacterium]|nr:PAS domain S-box protein [Candidatus Brocadiales bacterium]